MPANADAPSDFPFRSSFHSPSTHLLSRVGQQAKTAALLCAGVWVLTVTRISSAQSPSTERLIDLDEAIALADKSSLSQIAEAEVSIARGEKRAAKTIRFNPTLSLSAGPRFSTPTSTDLEASLSQTFELGGKRRHRTAAANARLRASQSRRQRATQQIHEQVRRTFARAQLANLRVITAKEAVEVAISLRELTDERLQAGKGTQLEVNQASAEVARAQAALLATEQAYEQACYALSSAVGEPGHIKLIPAGQFKRPSPVVLNESSVLQTVRTNRPEYNTFTAEREASQADVNLEHSKKIPDIALGATFAQEESGINIITFGLSIELPVWNRNQGAREVAQAAAQRTRALTQQAEDEITRQSLIAYNGYQRARQAVEAFDRGTRGNLRANLSLTRDSFEAGKISIIEFSVLRASFVDVELAYLDAIDNELVAFFDLRLALGADTVIQ